MHLQKKYQNVLLMCLLCWQITETLTANCCQEGATQTNPLDCTQYYVCSGGVLVSQSCPSGDYWNAGTCEQNNGQCCPGSCSGDELQVDPQNCAAYYQCVNGQIVNQKCATGTYFDTSIKACVVDSEGICVA
ncbi:chitin-binding domain protein cbd-1-like [Drosophila sulfurigaster albostrigata]|uniref:chitin-binding domain protein cbd-1-like n=1 Tax=Drosophila sulfurigaster albostrigata TaxID=89887 RepID=UPI002D219F1E|nr:chitin-binding domain protein cbd-1-like [Drosophila sulfurigaster albostrigata]